MGTREIDPRLQKLYDENKNVYSISKVNTINNCLYEAYKTYLLKEKGLNSCYGILGGGVHDTLEKITHGEATEADLFPAVLKDLETIDMLGLSFPKGRDGSDIVRDGWVANMKHFCDTYKAPKGKFETEEFFLYTTPDNNHMQGYIDLIKKNNDGSISIYDYKTSTMFAKKELLEHGRQLIIYALAKEQEGLKVKEVAWIMLKYCDVKFMGYKTSRSKNETLITKTIERRKLVKELEKHIRKKLEESGHDEVTIDIEMEAALNTNEIPKAVKDEFKIIPNVLKYPLTDELRQECTNYIDKSVKMWENIGEQEKDYPHRPFFKTQKNGKKVEDVFFCNTLCNHRKSCKFILGFNAERENKLDADDDDLFG